MKYRVAFSMQTIGALKELDRHTASIILRWVRNYLEGSEDPRQHGKWLAVNGRKGWRYSIGKYRLLAEIRDEEAAVLLVWLGKTEDSQ